MQFKVLRLSDGQEAADVDKDDIVVREDGHKVHELEIFSPRATLTTVLAMDISGSMANTSAGSGIKKIDEARKAAGIFLDNLSATFGDRSDPVRSPNARHRSAAARLLAATPSIAVRYGS